MNHQDKPQDATKSSPNPPVSSSFDNISTPSIPFPVKKKITTSPKPQLFGIAPPSGIKNGNGPFGASRSASFRAPSEKSSLSTSKSPNCNIDGKSAEKANADTTQISQSNGLTTVRVVKIAPRPPSQPIFRAVLPRPTYPTFANTQQNGRNELRVLEPTKPPTTASVSAPVKPTDPRLQVPQKQVSVISLIAAAQRANSTVPSANGPNLKASASPSSINGIQQNTPGLPPPPPSSESNLPNQGTTTGVPLHRRSFARPVSSQQQPKGSAPATAIISGSAQRPNYPQSAPPHGNAAAPGVPNYATRLPTRVPTGGASSLIARQSSSTTTSSIPITGAGVEKGALVLLDDVARSLRALWHHPPHQHISLYLRGMFRGKQDTLEKKISHLIADYFQPIQVNQRAARRQEEWAKILPTASHLVPLAPAGGKGGTVRGKQPLVNQEATKILPAPRSSLPTAMDGSKAPNAPNATVAPVVAPPRPLSRKAGLMQADIDYHTRNHTLYANDAPSAGIRKAKRRTLETDEDEIMTEEDSITNKKEGGNDSNNIPQQLQHSALRRSGRRPHPPQECLPPSKRARAE